MYVMKPVSYPNLDTPSGNMKYEVERFLSFNDVEMLLTASQLSNKGFFYNLQTQKITCFSCKIEHEATVWNIKHEPSCKFKQDTITFHVDKNFEYSSTSFRLLSTDSILPSHSPTPARELDMKNEEDRLRTFVTWDKNVPVEPTDLARNGFYFKGFADVVICAYCKLELRNWEEEDNVYTEHQRHNPNCSFLTTVLEISDKLSTLNMKYEQNRLKTFSNVSGVFAVCTKLLAQNGFYYTGRKDEVSCSSCHCKLSNWKKEDNIKQRHQNKSADCPFVQDEVDSLSRYQSNVIFDRPKHPQFALLNDRLKTYINWPADKKQTPQVLAEAGFYHTGETDTVICYCCDGGLCNWDEEDDPWIEHTRWYPRCTYVRQRKGDQFVNSVKRNEFSFSTDSNPDVDDANKVASPSVTQGSTLNSDVQIPESNGGPKISQSIRKSPTVLAVLELGYEENIVEYVIKKKIKETGSAFAKASLLLEAVVKHIEEAGPVVSKDQQEELEEQHEALVNPENQLNMDDKLREENRLLKEQKTCKICLDNDLSIVFLPCGHFVSCATCAPSLKNCPLCRSQIMGLVRTYMS